jgi:type II secretory pathway pseudopilin PulG
VRISHASSRRSGLSIVEVAVSLAILSVGMLAIFGSLSSSIRAGREARPRFLAGQAAQRVVEGLRADVGVLGAFYDEYWGSATVSGGVLRNDNTPEVYLDLDLVGAEIGNAYAEVIDPALQGRVILPPSDGGAMLRLIFLSEDRYNTVWGTTLDLDFNGSVVDGIEHDGSGAVEGPDYKMYPVLVEIHWRDESGDQIFRQLTVITDDPDLDPQRSF